MTLKPLKKVTLAHQAAESILSLIKKGFFKPEDKIPSERELCEKLKISKTPLREGIQMLVSLGILESRRGSGVYVKSANPVKVLEKTFEKITLDKKIALDIWEARKEMEKIVTQFALERAGKRDVNRMKRAIQNIKTPIREYESSTKFEIEFHTALARASHNEILVLMMSSIIPFFSMLSEELGQEGIEEKRTREIVKNHMDLVNAIEKKDKNLLLRTMKEHYNHLEETVKKYVAR